MRNRSYPPESSVVWTNIQTYSPLVAGRMRCRVLSAATVGASAPPLSRIQSVRVPHCLPFVAHIGPVKSSAPALLCALEHKLKGFDKTQHCETRTMMFCAWRLSTARGLLALMEHVTSSPAAPTVARSSNNRYTVTASRPSVLCPTNRPGRVLHTFGQTSIR